MKILKRLTIVLVMLVAFLAINISSSWAATDFPNRTIEIMMGQPPGGSSDLTTRIFKEYVSKILGVPVVSVYKPGASAAIASTLVAKAKSDGYTLLIGSDTPLVIGPLTKEVGYTLDDFTPITSYALTPVPLYVKDDGPYKTMKDFIQASKASNNLKNGNVGMPGVTHIVLESLAKMVGYRAIHIPFDGTAKLLTSVLGGHVDIGCCASSGGMVGPGRIRVLASPSHKRSEIFPNVPTLEELGYPIYGEILYALWAPKGTPKEVINKIYLAHKQAMEEHGKEITQSYRNMEMSVSVLSPDEVAASFQHSHEYFKKILGEMGMLRK